MLDRVTITGADDSVDVSELSRLTDEFPFVEWGILFSQSKQGTKRYPSWEWIESLVEEKRRWLLTKEDRGAMHWNKWRHDGPPYPARFMLSGHLCGQWVRDIENEGKLSIRQALIEHKAWGAGRRGWNRFQINWGRRGEQADIEKWRKAWSGWLHDFTGTFDFILQCPDGDCSSLERLRRQLADWCFKAVPLFDASGGLGKLPESWPQPWAPYCGYAGGLSPENAEEQIAAIRRKANFARHWIDVETGVRDADDNFDLGKVHDFLSIAKEFVDIEPPKDHVYGV